MIMNDEKDLEKMLKTLTSARGKEQAIAAAIIKGLVLSEELIDSTIKSCEDQNVFVAAGNIAKLTGQEEKAKEFYEQEILFQLSENEKSKRYSPGYVPDNIIHLAENLGLDNIAIDLYEERGNFHDAIKLAKKKEMADRVKDLQDKQIKAIELREDFSIAAGFAREAGLQERAIELENKELDKLIKAKDYLRAAKHADWLSWTDTALEIYSMCDSLSHAINYAESKGLVDKVKELSSKESIRLEAEKKWYSAAEYALKAGEFQRAKEVTKKQLVESKKNIEGWRIEIKERNLTPGICNHFRWISETDTEAISLAEKVGLFEEACNWILENYNSSSNHEEAIRLAKRNNATDLVIRISEQYIKELEANKRYELAAEVCISLGQQERAQEFYSKQVDLYESEGWFKNARDLADKAKLPKQKVLDLYIKEARQAEARGDILIAYSLAKHGENEELQQTYKAIIDAQSKFTTEDLGNNKYRHTTAEGITVESIGHDPVRLELFGRIMSS